MNASVGFIQQNKPMPLALKDKLSTLLFPPPPPADLLESPCEICDMTHLSHCTDGDEAMKASVD